MYQMTAYQLLLAIASSHVACAGSYGDVFPQHVRLVSFGSVHAKNHGHEEVLSKKEMARELHVLAQYEIDTYFIISQAIDSVTDADLKEAFRRMRDEISSFIETLCQQIRDLHREPPSFGRDFKGFFMQGYVAVVGLGSQKAVLTAMADNYATIQSAYRRAHAMKFRSNIQELIDKVYQTHQEHLNYIKSRVS